MAALKNIRKEKAALAYYETGNKIESYRLAGYSVKGSEKTIEKLAIRLFKDEGVLRRVKELQGKAEDGTVMSVLDKRRNLKFIVDRCMQSEAVVDSEGNPTGEYKFDAAGAVRAMGEDSKIAGHYAPVESKIVGKVEHDHTHVGLSETDRFIREVIEEGKKGASKKPVSH